MYEYHRVIFHWKNGSKFSHLLTVRADRADPPPLLTVSLTVKKPHFFGDSPKQCLWFCWESSKLMGKNAYFCVLLRIFFGENMPTEEKWLLLGIVLITRKSNQKWIFVRLRWPVVKVTGNVFYQVELISNDMCRKKMRGLNFTVHPFQMCGYTPGKSFFLSFNIWDFSQGWTPAKVTQGGQLLS